MTHKTRSKIRLISLFAILVMATAGLIYMTAFNSHAGAQAGQTQASSEDDSTEAAAEKDEEATEAEEEAPVPVEVAAAVSGPIASYISASANLVPEDQVKVLAEAEGRVAELEVDEGDRVSKGQILAALVRDEAEIALNKARLKAANAQLAFERAQGTREQGLISAEAFDKLKMEHEVASQEVAEAQWRLDKTIIRSPFSGVVTERLITLGQHLRPGDELFMVADFTPLVARIYLPERDVMGLETGRQVRLSLAAGSELEFAGRIRQISPVVDTATGTVKVTVEAVAPPSSVRPGAFVNVNIVREQHENAVLVPRESVVRELRSAHVFLNQDGVAVKRAVDLGLEEARMVEVTSGVSEGEQVIVAGQGGLDDGQKVKTL